MLEPTPIKHAKSESGLKILKMRSFDHDESFNQINSSISPLSFDSKSLMDAYQLFAESGSGIVAAGSLFSDPLLPVENPEEQF